MKKSLTTDPNSPIYVLNTPENSNINILQNYISIFKGILGNGIDLRGSKFTNLSEIIKNSGKKIIVDSKKNDNYMYYIGEMRNYSHTEEKTYENIKDYVYSLSTSVDANASFPVQMATVSFEASSRTSLKITENTKMMNLTLSIYNENVQIDLNQKNFFDNDKTPILQSFFDDLDNLIDNYLEIDNVENKKLWEPYETFFTKYGTHAISSIVIGSRMDLYYSSNTSEKTRISDLKNKACGGAKTFKNILENYKSGRLGDIINDDIENTFDWNSLDPPDDETCSIRRKTSLKGSKDGLGGENLMSCGDHMTPRPKNEKPPVTYPPESSKPPINPEIDVGLCTGLSESQKTKTVEETVNTTINILGGNPTINGELLQIFGNGADIANNPDQLKNNIEIIARFLASGSDSESMNKVPGGGVVDCSYIPMWDFVSNLFSISDIEKYYGIKRFQRFINNLINYFSFSSQYFRKNPDGTYSRDNNAYFNIVDKDNDKNIFNMRNRAETNSDHVLGPTNNGNQSQYVWNMEEKIKDSSYMMRDRVSDCPDRYYSSKDDSECGKDQCCATEYSRFAWDDCPTGFYKSYVFPANFYCNPYETPRSNIKSQSLVFSKQGDMEDDSALISSEIDTSYKMSLDSNPDYPLDGKSSQNLKNIKIDINNNKQKDRAVWKMDLKGRIHSNKNTSFCLDKNDDGTISYKKCNDDLSQKFSLNRVPKTTTY
jgi:hypothetical protein